MKAECVAMIFCLGLLSVPAFSETAKTQQKEDTEADQHQPMEPILKDVEKEIQIGLIQTEPVQPSADPEATEFNSKKGKLVPGIPEGFKLPFNVEFSGAVELQAVYGSGKYSGKGWGYGLHLRAETELIPDKLNLILGGTFHDLEWKEN